MNELDTGADNTWCPGCGNFGILRAVNKAVQQLEAQGIGRDTLVISAGIGCHGKIFDYLALNGLYSLHGRSIATISGMKMANPDLIPITFVGDGCCCQLPMRAARRSANSAACSRDSD